MLSNSRRQPMVEGGRPARSAGAALRRRHRAALATRMALPTTERLVWDCGNRKFPFIHFGLLDAGPALATSRRHIGQERWLCSHDRTQSL